MTSSSPPRWTSAPRSPSPSFAGLRVEVSPVEVSDEEELDARIETLRHRFGSLQGVDRPAAEGDYVVIDLNATIGGEEVDSVSGISYEIGSGTMLDGLDDAVVGLAEGGSTTFTTSLAGGEREGEEAEVTVTVSGVKEAQLPQLDDDFAQLASEFDTLEELRADLRSSAAAGKVEEQAVEARDKLMTALVEAADFPVPAGVIEAEVVRHLESEDRLEDAEHREEITPEVTDALRRQFLLDVLAEQLEVKVSQEELIDFLVRMAQQYRVDPNEFVSNADRTGQIPVFVAQLARNKAVALALRKVEVVDTEGASVDLSAFIGSDELDAVRDAAAAAVQDAAEAAEAEEVAEAADVVEEASSEGADEANDDAESAAADEAAEAEEAPAAKPKKSKKA